MEEPDMKEPDMEKPDMEEPEMEESELEAPDVEERDVEEFDEAEADEEEAAERRGVPLVLDVDVRHAVYPSRLPRGARIGGTPMTRRGVSESDGRLVVPSAAMEHAPRG